MMSVLNFRIEKINKVLFEVQEVKNLDNLNFGTSYKFLLNLGQHLIACVSEYDYRQDAQTVMKLQLECVFSIEEQCFNSLIKDDLLAIPQDILQYMATIAVGAARGEIHARCELIGSPLQEVVLPPINLTKIITKPAVFSLR